MKLLLLMILLASLLDLQGCQTPTPETSFQGEQCSPEFAPAELDQINGKWYIPIEGSVCRCRPYQINKDVIGPIKNSDGTVTVTRRPIQECNLIKGYKPSEDSKLWAVLDWWRVQIKTWLEENEKPLTDEGNGVGELGYR